MPRSEKRYSVEEMENRVSSCEALSLGPHELPKPSWFISTAAMLRQGAEAMKRSGQSKTADGVPVCEGDTAYHCEPRLNWNADGWMAGEPESLTLRLGAPHSHEDWSPARDLYSTPEAARKAAEEMAAQWNCVEESPDAD